MITRLKRLGSRILHRPIGMAMGERSSVRLPRKILNPSRISMGSRSCILSFSRLEAYDSHAGGSLDGRIFIGADVYIGHFCTLTAMNSIEIGDGCVLADFIYVSDTTHGLDPKGPPIMRQPLESKGPVIIGKRVFIGRGAAILPGVELGDNCVVGANAVVTRSFPAYSVVGGNPARLLKQYDQDKECWAEARSEQV